MLSLLLEAAKVASSSDPNDRREALIGSVGVRSDGVMVTARNEAVFSTDAGGSWCFPPAHAENRLAKKLDTDAIVYVARCRRDGSLAMARPCPDCQRVLRSRQVQRVYYTINDSSYGVWSPADDTDRVVSR